MTALGRSFRKGDLVEHVNGDGFIEAGQMGRVQYSPIDTGPHAFQVHVEWFDDTISFAWPREIKLVAEVKPVPAPAKAFAATPLPRRP